MLLGALCCINVMAQKIVVKGTVVEDGTSQPIAGATIKVQESKKVTTTDINGVYSIEMNKGEHLLVSFIGKKAKKNQVRGAVQDFVLEDEYNQLNEMVVIGYGSARKRDITGSITSVKSEELLKQPSLYATSALQGKVSGVQVVSTGRPGSSPSIRIRGLGTLNGNTSPLYIVDGMVTGDLANINTWDIESMEILKDASSAAIYGARAANGVVIVTTKNGKAGKYTASYSGYVGVTSPYGMVEMANAQEYANYQNAAISFDSPTSPLPFPDVNKVGKGTNWIDQVTRAGLVHNHDLSISGGTEKSKNYISLSYKDDQSIIKGEDYSRFTVRANSELKPNAWLTIRNNISFSNFSANNVPSNVIKDAYRQEPTFDILNDKGQYNSSRITNVGNPVASLYYFHKKSQGNRFQELFSAEAQVIKGLSVKSEIGVDMGWSTSKEYTPAYLVSTIQKNDKSNLSVGRYNSRHITWNNSINYTKSFGENHHINAALIMTTEEFTSEFLNGFRKDVPEKENLWYLDQGDVKTSITGNGGDKSTRVSYVARAGYTFMGKYILNGTIRREGSSRFPSSNRFGYFPSVGAAWIMSDESFLKDKTWLSSLKLKASYGIIGNDGIPNNAFVYTVSPGLNYVFGKDQALSAGSIEDAVKNKNLKWETTREVDFGVDFGFLQNRLTGDLGYYNKLTLDAFLNVELLATLGGGAPLTNKLEIANRGVEFRLNWADKINDKISYSVGTNWSFNRNEVKKVADAISLKAGNFGSGYQITNTVPGGEIGRYFVFESLGVFQSQDEINKYSWTNPQTGASQLIMPAAQPGQLKYRDVNNDGKISDEDKVFAGSYQPKAYFGLNAGLNFYGFDFSADLYGSLGAKIFNGMKGDRFGGENITKEIANNAWLPERRGSNIPRPSLAVREPSSYFIENADFLRLNNVTLGYTLPKSLVSKVKINSLRFYASVQNVFMLTNYSGFNVEQPGGTLDSGIEMDPYPNVRTCMFGINLNF